MATKKTFEGARRPAPKFNFMPKQATDNALSGSAAAGADDAAAAAAASDDEIGLSDDEEPEEVVETISAERDLRRSLSMAAAFAEATEAGAPVSRLHAEAVEQTILSTAFETPTTYNPLQKRQIKINLGTVPAPSHSASASQQASHTARPLLPNPAELALGQGYVFNAPQQQQPTVSIARPRTPPTPPLPASSNLSSSFSSLSAGTSAAASARPRTPPTPPLPSSSISNPALSHLRTLDFSRPPPGFEQFLNNQQQQQQSNLQSHQANFMISPNFMQPPQSLSLPSTDLPPLSLIGGPRGPLLGDRPVSEQTRRSLPLPSQLPGPPAPPPSTVSLVASKSLQQQQQQQSSTLPGRRVLLDEPPPIAITAETELDDDTEVKQTELFFEQLEAWLAHIKSYESDMNEYFQNCANQMHEHYGGAEQTEESKKVHETEYRKLYDEYEKFSAYMRQMSQHYEDTKSNLEKRRSAAIEKRDKRLAEKRALREKQLAAHVEPVRNAEIPSTTSSVSSNLLVEAYSTPATTASSASHSTLMSSSSTSAAAVAGAAAAAAVSSLSRMDLSDPNSWNKFAASLPANADMAAYYRIYCSQMVANFQRMLIGVPPAEAERLSAALTATLQSEGPAASGGGGGADSGAESDDGLVAGGLTLQGLTRNQRKKLRKRAKALQDAKAAKRHHRKLLLAAPSTAESSESAAIGEAGSEEDADSAAKKPTPPPGYMDPAGDPRLVMQDYFERFANGKWNYATWNQYITVMQRHNPAWYDVFISQSKQHGINWDDMYRYYTGGSVADHLSDLTGGAVKSVSGGGGSGDGPSLLELAAQPAPPPPPERLFDDDDKDAADTLTLDRDDLIELDALDNTATAPTDSSNARDNTTNKKSKTNEDDSGDDDDEDDDEDEDDDDDDWSFCKLCNQEFRSERGYLAHLRGVTHMKHALDRAASKKPHMFTEERARQAEAVKAEASAQQKHQMWLAAQVGAIQRTGLGGTFECLMCNVKCNSQKALDFHVNGDKHKKNVEERVKVMEAAQREKEAAEAAAKKKEEDSKEPDEAALLAKQKAEKPPTSAAVQAASKPKQQQQKSIATSGPRAKPMPRAQTVLNSCFEPLLGLQYVTEYQRINPMLECRCYCELCNLNFPVAELIAHTTGVRHRRLFLRHNYPDLFAILSQDQSPRSVRLRRYAIYAKRIEDWEGRKKINLKVEVLDENGDPAESQANASDSTTAGSSAPSRAVKYTLKSTKRVRRDRRRGDLEEGEIDAEGDQSDGGGGGEESDPEEGEALDNAGPPEQPGVVFEDAIVIEREPLNQLNSSSATTGGVVSANDDIVATRDAFIRRLKEQRFLSASEATSEAVDSFGREADWAIKRKKRAAGIIEDDADVIKFGAAASAASDLASTLASQLPRQQQQQQQQQQHMTSLVEQIRAMTGINLGISRAQTDAFRIPSIPGLRLDIDRIKDTPDPVAQMRNLVAQVQEFVGSQQKAAGYGVTPSSTSATTRLGLLTSASAASQQNQKQQQQQRVEALPPPSTVVSDKQHKRHKEKKEKKEKKRDKKERKEKEQQQQQHQKLMGAIHLPGQDIIIQVNKQNKKAKKHNKRDDKERQRRDKEKEKAKSKDKERKREEKEREKAKAKEKERKHKRREREKEEKERDTKRRRRADPAVLPAPDSLGLPDLSGSTVFDAYSALSTSNPTKPASSAAAIASSSMGAATYSTNAARNSANFAPLASSSTSGDSSDDDDYVEKSADWLASLARNSLYGGSSKSATSNSAPSNQGPSQPVLLGLVGGGLPPPPQPHLTSTTMSTMNARSQPLLATPGYSQQPMQSVPPFSYGSSQPPVAGASSLGLVASQQQQHISNNFLAPPPPMHLQPLLPNPHTLITQQQQQQQFSGYPNSSAYNHQLTPSQQQMYRSLPPPSQILPEVLQPQQQQQQHLYQQQQYQQVHPPPHQQLW